MKTRNGIWRLFALMALAFVVGCSADSGKSAADSTDKAPAKVAEVMTMARRDITLNKSYPAKLRSNREAVVIARVQGLLEKRYFKPGDQVKKGEKLYTIEPTIYQATVNQRKADLQAARAKAYQAKRDAERSSRLAKSNAISKQESELSIAKKRVAVAQVAQAEASLQSAQVDLGYTNVTAPVSGLISLSQVNVGNVVNSGTQLATITPLNPIEVRFQLPQADAFDLRRQRKNEQARISAVLEIPGQNGSEAKTVHGSLDFLGSSVDQNTATVQAQAIFDNPDNLYLPGQFVRVGIDGMKRYDVLAVPEIAVTQGLLGPQVFTLDKKNVAKTTNVTPGEEAGPNVIINTGLKPGDRVIVSDPGAIKADMTIKPQPYDASAAKQHATDSAEKQTDPDQSGRSRGAEDSAQTEAKQ